MLLWRILFFGGLIYTAIFFFTSGSDLVIDADLNAFSPSDDDTELRDALGAISSTMGKRIVLLLASRDSSQLELAYDSLGHGLKKIDGLSLVEVDGDLIDGLTDTLKRYRFHLLTAEQSQLLETDDHRSIVNTAYERLFQLGGSINALPFSEDPLAWFTDYLDQFLVGLDAQSGKEEKLDSEQFGDGYFYRVMFANVSHGVMNVAAQDSLSTELKRLEVQLMVDYPVELFRSGVFFFASEAAAKSKQDLSFIGTYSLIGLFSLLIYIFRAFSALILPLISIVSGVSVAFAVTHALFGSVHILTIVLGSSLIGVVIDYSLHYFYHIGSEREVTKNRSLYKALLLSLATSLIGYAALGFSGLTVLNMLAVFACCGLIMAWLSVVSLAPIILPSNIREDTVLLPRLLRFIEKPISILPTRFIVLAMIGLIGVCTLYLTYGSSHNDDPRQLFSPSLALASQDKLVSSVINDYEPGNYLLIEGDSSDQLYERLNLLRSRIDKGLGESLVSIMNWFPSVSEQERNYTLQAELYKEDGVVEKLLVKLSADASISNDLRSSYDQAKKEVLSLKELIAILPEPLNQLWMKHNHKEYAFVLIPKGTDIELISTSSKKVDGITFISGALAAEKVLYEQRVSASKLLLMAYTLIGIILVLRFRTINSVFMLFVPLTATASTILILILSGQALNLFHTMALFLVLGLGMDYVIFCREMSACSLTKHAIVLSALTTVFSFGLLALSEVPAAHAFGITLLLGNMLNLIFTLTYAQFFRKKEEMINVAG